MSTRCQIGFYESPETPLAAPDALICRHSDGYPEGKWGVIAALKPWAKAFAKARRLDDTEYAAARALVALIRHHGVLDEVYGYGICGDKALHGDIEWYYRVDPAGITVYRVTQEAVWDQFEQQKHIPLRRPRATKGASHVSP